MQRAERLLQLMSLRGSLTASLSAPPLRLQVHVLELEESECETEELPSVGGGM